MSERAKLVFLPGTLCTERTFRYQVQHLEDVADSVVIALREGSSISACAQWVLAQAPETFVLVGFSQGAIVALEIMRQVPERVGKLCLISANPSGSTPGQIATWTRWQNEAKSGGFEEIVSAFASNVHPERLDDADLISVITNMALELGPDVFKLQLDALKSRIDSRPYLQSIRCPTLLIGGRQDKLTPLEYHHDLSNDIAHAALIPVEDCGHYVPLEQPQTLTALLRYFLVQPKN